MPLYEPPAGADPAQLIEDLAEQVRATYADVENQVLAEVQKLARKGKLTGSAEARAAALRELQAHVQQIVARGIPADWAAQVIATAQAQGTAAAAAMIGLARHLPVARRVSTTMQTAIAMLQADLSSRMDVVRNRILRYPVDQLGNWLQQGDVYQRTIAKTSAGPLLNQARAYDAQKLAMQRFLEQGVTGFTDKAGRRWSLGAYAEMATRSAVQRAYTDASIARMQASGINLVQIVIGATACKHCGQWAGKILSTNGQTGDITIPNALTGQPITIHIDGTLDQARSAGWQHPSCRCFATAYLPGVTNTSNLTRYDPAKEAARDQQRYLETRVRGFKRRAQLAEDPAEAKKWAARARGEQKRIRDLLADKPYLVRKYKREQVHWATGRGGTPPTIKTPPAPPKDPFDDLPTLADTRPASLVSGSNPHFAESNEYQVNCSRCATAVELRARGYDVTARAYRRGVTEVPDGNSNTLFDISSQWLDRSGNEVHFTHELSRAQVQRVVESWPDGARGFITATWKGRGSSSHIWNVVKRGDNIEWIDGQPGKVAVDDYFANARSNSLSLLRTDELVPKETILKWWVQPAEKAEQEAQKHRRAVLADEIESRVNQFDRVIAQIDDSIRKRLPDGKDLRDLPDWAKSQVRRLRKERDARQRRREQLEEQLAHLRTSL